MTEKRLEEIDKLNGFELNVLKLLHCIATMRRGHTYEQRVYLNLLETIFFPEEVDEENTMLKEQRHEDINELSVIAMKYKALEKENKRLQRCINEIYTIARLEEV